MNNKLIVDKIQTEITNNLDTNKKHWLKHSDKVGLIITTEAMDYEKLKSLPDLSKNAIQIIKQNYSVVKKYLQEKENVIVAMRKLVDAQAIQIKTKKPVAIIWSFLDGLVYERLDNLKGSFYFGGRKPREGSTHDLELIVSIKKDSLKEIAF